MTRAPFVVTHDGWSVLCHLVVDDKAQVKHIEAVRALAQGDGPRLLLERVRQRAEMLNDLMQAEVPFALLASCRRSPGIFGAIIDPAASIYEDLHGAISSFEAPHAG